jgi:Rrf2 family iron-sulfur cluster assembly transcriptional regulator
MKLSTQGQHAILAMLALATHHEDKATRLTDIAQQQGISLSYLEQIFAKLRQHELVEGMRGPGGGYVLGRAADDINLAEILQAVEDDILPEKPKASKKDSKSASVLVQKMWVDLSKQFYGFLSNITLASLLEGHELPTKQYRLGETASMIARMFPARAPQAGYTRHAAM